MKTKLFTLLFATMASITAMATEGALTGRFTINANGDQVVFSQGNLQYVGTWQFAENQWDYFGESQSDNHRDLFGWGTGDAPNNVSEDNSSYSVFTDWGANAIINGGNQTGLWRTLSSSEWYYVLNMRPNASLLKGFAMIDDLRGYVLLPDDCQLPQEITFETSVLNWTVNNYSSDEWNILESVGAVFFPVTGIRDGQLASHIEEGGAYWGADATCSSEGWVSGGMFTEDYSFRFACNEAHVGHAVRLVKDVFSPCLLASGTCGDNLTWELSCDSVLTISGTGEMGDVTWGDYKEQIKEVVIEDGVTSIASTAFYECSNLSAVSIPNSVTKIGKFAFSNCPSLTSLTIPASVTQIDGHFVSSLNDSHYNIVMESPNITSLSVEAGNPVYDSRNNCNAIIETATNTLLAGCQNTIIPNTVTKIGYCAFYRCSALKSIDIPSSVTSIGAAAFNETGLTSVVLPHNVTIECEDSQAYWFLGAFGGCHELTNLSFADGEGGASVIGHNAFSDCDKLTEVTFPNNITSIGNYAFLRCNSITSIIIPSSVTNIGNTAFACDNLASLTCYAVTPPSAELYIANPSIPLYVPTESVEAYRNADVWKDFTNILPIGGSQEDPGHPTNPGTYQVLLNASIEGAGVLTGAGMYAEGAEVTISAEANAGYTFTQWSDGVTSASRTITMIARDTTLMAEFSVNSYQLVYKVDGEDYSSENVD